MMKGYKKVTLTQNQVDFISTLYYSTQKLKNERVIESLQTKKKAS